MILNTKRIHNSFWRNFPARAKQMPSKVLIVGKKKRIFTLLLRSSVIYHDKPPPLRWIIVIYSCEASDGMPQAKRVYNLVAREARVHHVNRAWS